MFGSIPARVAASTAGLTTGQAPSPCAVEDELALWFAFEVPEVAREQAMVFTVESAFDTTLALYGACGELIACVDDQPHDLAPKLDRWLEPGQIVRVRVGGWGGTRGDFVLRVEPANEAGRPPNDRCEDAVEVTQERPAHAATWNASGEDLSSCGPEDAVDVWYRFVAPSAGEYQFAIRENLISAHYITVFSGCAATEELACGFGGASATLAAGQEVVLRVGTNPSVADWFNVVALPAPPAVVPPNDSWLGAIEVGVPSTTTATTRGATREAFNWGPDCGPYVQSAIWYAFEAPTSDVYVFDTAGSALEDTVVALFEPCDARGEGPPGLLACNDFDAPGDHGRLDGFMEAGARVCIAVAGRYLSDAGEVTLNVSRLGAPPVNDTCAGALPIAAGEQLYGVNYASRAVDALTPCPYGNFPLWYRFTAPADGVYKIDTKAGRDAWPDLAVFTSCEPAAEMRVCSAEDQPAVPVSLRRGETVYIRVSTTVWWRGVIPLRVGPVREDGEEVESGPEVVEEVEEVEEVEVDSGPEVVEVVDEVEAVEGGAEVDEVEAVEVGAEVDEVEDGVVVEAARGHGCGCEGGGGGALGLLGMFAWQGWAAWASRARVARFRG
ncbi:MAG: hypothetical protein JNJ59_09635 [Deltaproteobacteria bacterium]|nr:hypothetical protein [Deltaproteobacteria bacterium]